MRRWLGLVAVLMCTLAVRFAAAGEAPAYRVELSAGEGAEACDQPATLAALVEQILVAAWIDPAAPRALRVRIERGAGGRFEATLRLLDAGGAALVTRHLAYRANTEIFRVLYNIAFEAALMIEPVPPLPSGLSSPACSPCRALRPPLPAPPVGQAEAWATVKTSAVRAARALRVEVSAGGAWLSGVTPEAALGGQLGVGLRGAGWSVELAARATSPVKASPLGKTILQAWTMGGAAAGCWRLGQAALCGVMSGGWLQGTVIAVPGKRVVSYASGAGFLGFGGSARFDVPVRGPLALRFAGELLGTAWPGAIKEPLGATLWTTRPVVGLLGFSAVASF